ncbi:MAG: SUMF1/EgtB/PvdO family nonheme iron enzyme [Anaerolineae bacterium]
MAAKSYFDEKIAQELAEQNRITQTQLDAQQAEAQRLKEEARRIQEEVEQRRLEREAAEEQQRSSQELTHATEARRGLPIIPILIGILEVAALVVGGILFAGQGRAAEQPEDAQLVAEMDEPTAEPTAADTPTSEPTDRPTPEPTATNEPTPEPTIEPTPETVDPVTPLFTSGVTNNSQWGWYEQTIDGVEMVLIPPGCFTMGSTNAERSQERPQHEVCIDAPFWLDKHEVTNAQYGRQGSYSGDLQPRETISWYDAREHCQNRGGRLPTEAEWEFAARGPDSRIIGNSVLWSFATKQFEAAAPGANISWVGATFLLGNVAEWTSSIYDESLFPYEYDATDGREDPDSTLWRSVRGGGWNAFLPSQQITVTAREGADPNTVDSAIGFRCAMDVDLANFTYEPQVSIPDNLDELAYSQPTTNDEWEPIEAIVTGSRMVLVPTGCFMMGNERDFNAQPVEEVCFDDPFWIDQFEKRNYIDWFDALSGCQTRGARLPSEAEW